VCVIELNDQSHTKESRQGRDNFLERVCTAAGIPLIFFPAKSTYTLAEISASIANAMGAKVEPSATTAPIVLGDVNVSAIKQDFAVAQEIDSGPDCPRCSSQMVRRMAKSGENAGKEFWGCTKFPACRGMVLS
jgi:ssDNA-binding Zn-finger/Zn-ribbon topoisomerase 1